jgi:hypothetical protein
MRVSPAGKLSGGRCDPQSRLEVWQRLNQVSGRDCTDQSRRCPRARDRNGLVGHGRPALRAHIRAALGLTGDSANAPKTKVTPLPGIRLRVTSHPDQFVPSARRSALNDRTGIDLKARRPDRRRCVGISVVRGIPA